MIGIDVEESDNTVRAYRKKYGIEYPIAMDANGGFTSALGDKDKNGNQNYPAHLLIDRDGYLACFRQGSLTQSEIASEIETLLGPVQPPKATPTALP